MEEGIGRGERTGNRPRDPVLFVGARGLQNTLVSVRTSDLLHPMHVR